jgi:hypothetical protein
MPHRYLRVEVSSTFLKPAMFSIKDPPFNVAATSLCCLLLRVEADVRDALNVLTASFSLSQIQRLQRRSRTPHAQECAGKVFLYITTSCLAHVHLQSTRSCNVVARISFISTDFFGFRQ